MEIKAITEEMEHAIIRTSGRALHIPTFRSDQHVLFCRASARGRSSLRSTRRCRSAVRLPAYCYPTFYANRIPTSNSCPLGLLHDAGFISNILCFPPLRLTVRRQDGLGYFLRTICACLAHSDALSLDGPSQWPNPSQSIK